jgi:uncharacterized protein (DUF983 family)
VSPHDATPWRVALQRALRRRCPACGARVFDTYFRLRAVCPGCGLLTDRGEPDYFLGALLLNLIAAESIPLAVVLVLGIATGPAPSWPLLLVVGLTLAVVSPVACYPFAKTLWLFADMRIRAPVWVSDTVRPDS